MKILPVLLTIIIPCITVQAQTTTTVRSQGSGSSGSYVAPVTTKTYTTPAPANKPYVAPAKTNNYNAPSSTSQPSGNDNSSAPPASSGGGGGEVIRDSDRPDYGIKFKTSADKSLEEAIKVHDWDAAFKLFELPDEEFEERAGGGKRNLAYLLVDELGKLCVSDYSLLPLMYKAIYTRKLYYGYPVFGSIAPEYFVIDLAASEFAVNNACIFMGDYQTALTNLRSHTMYGASKPYIKKKKETWAGQYEAQEVARNYINYMAGRCYQELGMADEAKKYLGLGKGFEEMWDRLVSEGKAAR